MFHDEEGEDGLKVKLLEMLMEEMDGVAADKLRKKPEVEIMSVEAEPVEEEGEMILGEEGPEDKLRRRIEAMRKKA